MKKRPNIILILNDDMGFSDLGCYGGEIHTPALDTLAAGGLRYTQFYNTARCCPSRASLLTGLHPHQANVGHMMGNDGIDGYLGDLSHNAVTLAEVLKQSGYATCMSGKWHVTRNIQPDRSTDNWPCQRGFEDYYGILDGAADYYNPEALFRNNTLIEPDGDDFFLTDAITDEAIRQIDTHFAQNNGQPLFQYLAYTAPHWPLHAPPEDIAKYHGVYDKGWDQIRAARLERMIEMGIIHPNWQLSPRDPSQPPWEEAADKEWQTRRMEVYAAQIERMDRGIGRVVETLRAAGQLNDTVILFLSDNGGCAEELTAAWTFLPVDKTRDGRPVQLGNDPATLPGPDDTYQSYGIPWANVSDTPFRKYKHWVHEGGIATPLIVHWPNGIRAVNELRHQPGQLTDIMATLVDIAGADYPAEYAGRAITPMEGCSLMTTFDNRELPARDLFWEHEGNCAVRRGPWKLVKEYPKDWELYNMLDDRTELNNLAAAEPGLVDELSRAYEVWAERCNVMPWADLCKRRETVGVEW
jgi:arylsulfatase A-like enzyme